MRIREARAKVILNSKAEPTLEVLFKVDGVWVSASTPSGTSAGKHEVRAWPKAENIDAAVSLAKEKLERLVFPKIVGKDVEPEDIDKTLEEIDGTVNFSNLGGNAALAVSIAAVKAYAWDRNLNTFEAVSELYKFKPKHVMPLENFVGGGAHGGSTDIQEFLVSAKAKTMRESILALAWAYRTTKELLRRVDPWFSGALTLESAFVTSLETEDILTILSYVREGLESSGYIGELGLDVAASELWNNKKKKYIWAKEGEERTTEEQLEYMEYLCKKYHLAYLEDPFHEDDFESFQELQKRVDTTIVGDDLFVTNAERLVDGVGGIIIKPNQRGTLLRTVETIKRARRKGMKIIVSHRSGETEDTFIAHFAVGVGADYAKIGAAGIRITKLNELLRISEMV